MKKTAPTISINKEPKSLVLNRINMVNKLGSKDYYTEDTNALIRINDKWWARPSRDYQGLRLYLLLTCFDALGRYPGKWNNVYSHLAEKLDIDPHSVTTRKADAFPLDYTIVYQTINDVYALKNSFYYFINSIIGPTLRKELMNSIVVKKIGKYSSDIKDYDASDSEKLKFLFDIRNCYNYQGTNLGCGERITDVNDLSGGLAIDDDKDYHFSVQWNPNLMIRILEEVISRANRLEPFGS